MDSRIIHLTRNLKLKPGGSADAIKQTEAELGVTFPAQYTAFLLRSNGAEGPIGEASYLALWPVEEIPSLNEGYSVDEFAPGLLLFGSDGADTASAFDMRTGKMPIVEVPFIGMDLDAVRRCGESFLEFLEYLDSDRPSNDL
jgi:hypothetical protein